MKIYTSMLSIKTRDELQAALDVSDFEAQVEILLRDMPESTRDECIDYIHMMENKQS